MEIKNFIKFVFAIVVCEIAGVIGSLFTYPQISTWYATLQKPGFSPPNWLFAPVWTILFALMGISAYLVWSKGLENKEVKMSLFIFSIQLALNVMWSFLFFGLRSPFYSLMEIIALWAAIALTTLKFFKVSKSAGLLFLPYMLWVSFAAVLNFYIWKLNP